MFNRKKKIKQRKLFAVSQGKFIGDFYIFTSNLPDEANNYNVVILPELTLKPIPKEYIDHGIKIGVLEFVERLDKSTYNTIMEEVEKRQSESISEIKDKTSEYYHRREQFITSGVLDSEKSK